MQYPILLAALLLVEHSVFASDLKCGVTTQCANITAAQAPIKVKQGEYVTNTWQWQQYPGVLSWSQCQDQCKQTTGCKSFNYQLVTNNPYLPSIWYCYLYFHPVSTYSIPCGSEDPSLDQFWDVGCPKLTPQHSGAVPKHPNTNQLNGTCNSVRPPKDLPRIFADQLATGFNINQTECSNYCRRVQGCKSYWWQPNPTAQFNPPFQQSAEYYPWNSTSTNSDCSLAPPQCLLLSQPVSSYVEEGHGGFVETALYDLNCPTPDNSTASRASRPFKYGPEPSSCKI